MFKIRFFPVVAFQWLHLFSSHVAQCGATFSSSRGYCSIETSPVVIFTFDDTAQQYRLDYEKPLDGINIRGLRQQDARNEFSSIKGKDDVPYVGKGSTTKAAMPGNDGVISLSLDQISNYEGTRASLRGRKTTELATPTTLIMRKCPCTPLWQDNETAFYCPAEVDYCYVNYVSYENPYCVTEELVVSWIRMMWMPLIISFILLGLSLTCSVMGHNFIGFLVSQVFCVCTPLSKSYTRWAASRIMRRNPGRAAILIRNALRRQHGIRFSPPRRLSTQQQMELDARRRQAEEAIEPTKVALKTRKYRKVEPEDGTIGKDDDGMYDACAICFLDLEDGDRVGVLETCSHEFHSECLKVWLAKRNVCPLCLGEGAHILDGTDKPSAPAPQPDGLAAQSQPGSALTNQHALTRVQEILLSNPPLVPTSPPSENDSVGGEELSPFHDDESEAQLSWAIGTQ